jgi:hypothetical protein
VRLQADPAHVGIGRKLADFQGNVPGVCRCVCVGGGGSLPACWSPTTTSIDTFLRTTPQLCGSTLCPLPRRCCCCCTTTVTTKKTDGVGDWSDPKYADAAGTKAHTGHGGATHSGGAPIQPGGPGKRHESEAVGGGPAVGGHKTNINTLG